MIHAMADVGRNAFDLALRKIRKPSEDYLTVRVFGASPVDGLFIRLPRDHFSSFAEFLADPGEDRYMFGDSRTTSTVEKEGNGLTLAVWRTGSGRKKTVPLDFDGRVQFCESVLRMMEETP